MIIVSQDNCTIVNFSNIQNIRIEPYGTHIKGKKIYKIFAGNFEGYTTELGTYDTEERAKEVLQEIVKATIETRKSQELNNLFGGAGIIPSNTYYEMPED